MTDQKVEKKDVRHTGINSLVMEMLTHKIGPKMTPKNYKDNAIMHTDMLLGAKYCL